MKLESPVFKDGQPLPAIHTRDGDNISPPLHWSDVPAGTKSFAVIFEDQNAPSGKVAHWVLFNLPPIMTALDREVPDGGRYGSQASQGVNDFGTIGYTGPTSTPVQRDYIITLYALNSLIDIKEGCTKTEFLAAAESHILEQAELKTAYTRTNKLDVSKELREARAHEDAYDLSVHNNEQQEEDGRYDQSDESRKKA